MKKRYGLTSLSHIGMIVVGSVGAVLLLIGIWTNLINKELAEKIIATLGIIFVAFFIVSMADLMQS